MTITRNLASLESWIEALAAITDLGPDDIERIKAAHARALATLDRYVPEVTTGRDIVVNLGTFRDGGGYQAIAEGAVSDRSIPERNEYNWHLQNTSQWLFACGIVWDKNRRELSLHT